MNIPAKWQALAGALVVLGVATGTFWGVRLAVGEPWDVPPPPPADVLPIPPSPEPSEPKPPDEFDSEPGIDFSKPLPAPIEVDLGPRTVLIPKGATLAYVIAEPPPIVDDATPEIEPPHLRFWQVERGNSRVRIDVGTGEVFLWDVADEDREDFQRMIRP